MVNFLFMLSLIGNAIAVYYVWAQHAARNSFEQRAEAERVILRQAMYARGHLTAVETAARSNVPLALIESTLREMTANNQCLSDLDADGRAIFVFPQFDDEPQRREAIEYEILRAARIHNGELSIEELALATDLNLAQARAWLVAMAARGTCTQTGKAGERYRFEGLARTF